MDSGFYLLILGFKRCLTEEEDVQERHSSMDRDKGRHNRWVYLSADRRKEMGKDSAYNKKIAANGRIERNMEYKEFQGDC